MNRMQNRNRMVNRNLYFTTGSTQHVVHCINNGKKFLFDKKRGKKEKRREEKVSEEKKRKEMRREEMRSDEKK